MYVSLERGPTSVRREALHRRRGVRVTVQSAARLCQMARRRQEYDNRRTGRAGTGGAHQRLDTRAADA
jgi:hypothetical protein